MTTKINRRTVLAGTIATGAALGATKAFAQAAPAIMSSYRPLVVGAGNGHRLKNENGETGIEIAYRMILAGDDVLDSIIACVNLPEISGEDASVGYGGLPDAAGNVTLDSCVMHGPRKMAGGVACIEGVKAPSFVAKDVMNHTDHHLLAGQGAQDFARERGYEILDDLNTDNSRQKWQEWKERVDRKVGPGQVTRLDTTIIDKTGFDVAMEMVDEGKIDPEHFYGTINCQGMNAKGDICGVTTTSGRGFKVPGRVGDSPILGAGLYVDNDYGSAGSTGRGEANLYSLASFLLVEKIREGMHPTDAGVYVVRRIMEQTVAPRLLNEKGEPNFGLSFYALDKKGRYGGVALRGNAYSRYAVHTENGPELMQMESVL